MLLLLPRVLPRRKPQALGFYDNVIMERYLGQQGTISLRRVQQHRKAEEAVAAVFGQGGDGGCGGRAGRRP